MDGQSISDTARAARDFLINREKGKPIRKLKGLYPYLSYLPNEYAIKGNLENNYTSKIHGDIPKEDKELKLSNIESSEILSISFQYLYGELTCCGSELGSDTEFRNFMYRMLKRLRDGNCKTITL